MQTIFTRTIFVFIVFAFVYAPAFAVEPESEECAVQPCERGTSDSNNSRERPDDNTHGSADRIERHDREHDAPFESTRPNSGQDTERNQQRGDGKSDR